MNMQIPDSAAAVIAVLREEGHEAYVVGGCVRDTLLGRIPDDWDVATSALPEQTLRLFRDRIGFKTYETGIRHGTVLVLSHGEPIETTTFRIDGEYSDGRRPDSVEFTDSLRADLARRDFTVNAMAYSEIAGLCDPYGGVDDLARRCIRCVGDPEKRFSEDALRVMRAIRFSSTLGFSVEEKTKEAAMRQKERLLSISRERIRAEWEKLLSGQDAGRVIYEFFPILCAVIPALSEKDAQKVGARVDKMPKQELSMRLAALLDGCATPQSILRELRFPKKTISAVTRILTYCRAPLENKLAVRQLCREIGVENAEIVIEYKIAVGTAEDTARTYWQEIVRDGDCLSLAAMKIGGRTLMEMGVPKNQIGETLEALLFRIMAGELENQGAELRNAVREALRRQEKG